MTTSKVLRVLCLIVFVFLFRAADSVAQATLPTADMRCLSIEGLRLGCVPSTVHSCVKNKKVDDRESICKYGKNWRGLIMAQSGPIQFYCSSYKTEQVIEQTPEGPITRTVSTCIAYQTPTCDEICTGCWNDYTDRYVGISRGCIICTRKPCPDEPNVTMYCPSMYLDYQLTGEAPRCAAATRCPNIAQDPLGKVHNVIIRTPASCNPPQPPKLPDAVLGGHCPWKDDRRTKTGCEPIDPDNVNP